MPYAVCCTGLSLLVAALQCVSCLLSASALRWYAVLRWYAAMHPISKVVDTLPPLGLL